MASADPHKLLAGFGLKQTKSRLAVIDVLSRRKTALSQAELIGELGDSCDRATVYRTLGTLLDKGLLHKVFDGDQAVKFALCTDRCASGHHYHEHMHFKCVECGVTTCLDSVQIQYSALPKGYKKLETNFLVIGICKLHAKR